MTDHLRTTKKHFAGGLLQQTYSGLYWLDLVLQEAQPKSILEIGTGAGNFTVWLACYAPDRVTTIDTVDRRPPLTVELHKRLGVQFVHRSIFSLPPRFFTFPKPQMVLCDGGDKLLEFLYTAPRLESGDWIGAHDAGTEFPAESPEVQAMAESCGLLRWNGEAMDNDRAMWAVWRKL